MATEAIRAERDRFADRILDALAGTIDLYSIYLGDRLGLYRSFVEDGPQTTEELAAATDTHERYIREWCEQQTVSGMLVVDDPTAPPERRRYRLPEPHVEVLTDEESLTFLAPFAQLVVGAVAPIERLVDAYRTGDGVPYADYGRDVHEGVARGNRPSFLHLLGQEWLPVVPDVDASLRRVGARVADIGCGHGYSAIGIARAYPTVTVDGFDLDATSVAAARETVAEAGLEDRVTIHQGDAADLPVEAFGEYDLVTAFECVHDMADPVGALATMRNLAGDDGTVLVVDERVGETFTGGTEGDDAEFEWLMYGWSVLHCLPVGMAEHPSAATGTVLRAGTMRGYASEAGFDETEELGVEHPFFRVYRLADESTGEEGRDA